MDDAKRQLVQRWLLKAKHDLATARKLSSDPDPYLDTAIFHCQQAAEKSVKGFLVFHDRRFEKTHDIAILLTSAIALDRRFSSWLDAGAQLTPYAGEFRYPSEIPEPEKEEFKEALKAAEGLYEFVLSLLPKEAHP